MTSEESSTFVDVPEGLFDVVPHEQRPTLLDVAVGFMVAKPVILGIISVFSLLVSGEIGWDTSSGMAVVMLAWLVILFWVAREILRLTQRGFYAGVLFCVGNIAASSFVGFIAAVEWVIYLIPILWYRNSFTYDADDW